MLPRLRTVPDLLAGRISGGNTSDEAVALVRQLKLTKLLLKVTVQRSLGPVQVLIPSEAKFEDLIAVDAQKSMEEEKAAVHWEIRVDFVLVNHEFGLLFEALEEGMDINTNEDLYSICLMTASWLVHTFSILPDTRIVGLHDLSVHMKDILKGLMELKKSSVMAFEMLKIFSEEHNTSAISFVLLTTLYSNKLDALIFVRVSGSVESSRFMPRRLQ